MNFQFQLQNQLWETSKSSFGTKVFYHAFHNTECGFFLKEGKNNSVVITVCL